MGSLWKLLVNRPGSREDWLALQVGAVLTEDVLGERAWASMVWSEFWSKIRSGVRSELGLRPRFGFKLAPERGDSGLP